MKRLAPFALLLAALALVAVPALTAIEPEPPPAPASAPAPVSPAEAGRSPFEVVAPVATAVTTITGIAISPLLGTGAYGAYHYFKTPADQRGSLPWFAQMRFWLPALLIVGVCAAKDTLGATLPPGWKKPLDVLELVENKASALIAAGVVIPFTLSALSKLIIDDGGAAATGAALMSPLAASGLATIQVAVIDGAWALQLLALPFAIIVFALVWMASNAITVLILISPWGAIDAVLKIARTSVLGLLALSAALEPWVGAVLSLVVIVIAYFVAGWAFRLTVFGAVCSWDFLTLRRKRFKPAADANRMFATGKFASVPARTYGRLVKSPEGALSFSFRPWLVLPERSIEVPPARGLAVGRGLFFSMIDSESAGLFFLPPRYCGHADELVAIYNFSGVREAGLRKAWSWIKETMGYGPGPAVAGSP